MQRQTDSDVGIRDTICSYAKKHLGYDEKNGRTGTIDSLDSVEFVMYLESEFSIDIHDSEIDKIIPGDRTHFEKNDLEEIVKLVKLKIPTEAK